MDGFQCSRLFLRILQYEQHGSHQGQCHIQLLRDWKNKMILYSQKNVGQGERERIILLNDNNKKKKTERGGSTCPCCNESK